MLAQTWKGRTPCVGSTGRTCQVCARLARERRLGASSLPFHTENLLEMPHNGLKMALKWLKKLKSRSAMACTSLHTRCRFWARSPRSTVSKSTCPCSKAFRRAVSASKRRFGARKRSISIGFHRFPTLFKLFSSSTQPFALARGITSELEATSKRSPSKSESGSQFSLAKKLRR